MKSVYLDYWETINLKMNFMLSIINFFLFFNNLVIESNFKFVLIIMLHNKLSGFCGSFFNRKQYMEYLITYMISRIKFDKKTW